MYSLNPDYIVGLVDGEGSFTVYIRNVDIEKKAQRRVTAEPKFYVKLVEGDKDILYVLKEFFGCGSVYFQKIRGQITRIVTGMRSIIARIFGKSSFHFLRNTSSNSILKEKILRLSVS